MIKAALPPSFLWDIFSTPEPYKQALLSLLRPLLTLLICCLFPWLWRLPARTSRGSHRNQASTLPGFLWQRQLHVRWWALRRDSITRQQDESVSLISAFGSCGTLVRSPSSHTGLFNHVERWEVSPGSTCSDGKRCEKEARHGAGQLGLLAPREHRGAGEPTAEDRDVQGPAPGPSVALLLTLCKGGPEGLTESGALWS